MLLPVDGWPTSEQLACSSVPVIACSLFNTYEAMNTNALVAGFNISIPLAAPMMTILVRAVRAVQATVHENHGESVIDYLTEVCCDILHLLGRSLSLAVPEVFAFWYGSCPRSSHRPESHEPESTRDLLLFQDCLAAFDTLSDAGGHVRLVFFMCRVPKVWFAIFGSMYNGKCRGFRHQCHVLMKIID